MSAADRVFVIAEAGVNHNGSLERAIKMVDVAADAGADAVKFQTFRAERLVTRSARKAAYQVANTGEGGDQLGMLRALELDLEAHRLIAAHCKVRNIAFMSTAFDLESLAFLAGLDMPAIKIPSGDLTAAPLVLAAARLGRPLIVSTGMADLADIERALGVIAFGLTSRDEPSEQAFAVALKSEAALARLREMVTLLHCVTEYPAPIEDANLRAMDVMKAAFGLRVGYSDHTMGISVALAAVARGACVIEKHFTLDCALPGPDHRASLEPGDLATLIEGIRTIEKALGVADKRATDAERKNISVARRSLVAATDIRRGEIFSSSNLDVKRPGNGADPYRYWALLGTEATRDYTADEVIDP